MTVYEPGDGGRASGNPHQGLLSWRGGGGGVKMGEVSSGKVAARKVWDGNELYMSKKKHRLS